MIIDTVAATNNDNNNENNKAKSILEIETQKVLWDFDIQTNHLTSARQSDQEIVNNQKDNLPNRRPSPSRQTNEENQKKAKRVVST